MTTAITQNIVGFSVVDHAAPPTTTAPAPATPILMQRPDVLQGATYKLKTPLSEHALYITINDIVLNPGTPDETRRPCEMFINSKAMEHFQWIVALTRVISAVFRHGGAVEFLVDELRSIFDPKGGYFKKGGKYMPSLVAEIGDVLERHLDSIGLMWKDTSLADAARAMVAEKTAEPANHSGYPDHAQLCLYCATQAAVLMDGCLTCLACGQSKCG